MPPASGDVNVKQENKEEDRVFININDGESCDSCNEDVICHCANCKYRNNDAYNEEDNLIYIDSDEENELPENRQEGEQTEIKPKVEEISVKKEVISSGVLNDQNPIANDGIDGEQQRPLESFQRDGNHNENEHYEDQQQVGSNETVELPNRRVNKEPPQCVPHNQNNEFSVSSLAPNQTSSQKYECPICLITFNRKVSHEAHMLKHALSDVQASEENFAELQTENNLTSITDEHRQCYLCLQIFTSESQLNEHLQQHSKRRYSCVYCRKMFHSYTELNNHRRIHTGEKPFLCSACGKSFNQKANFNRHRLNIHAIKPYQCSTCKNTFMAKEYQVHRTNCNTNNTQNVIPTLVTGSPSDLSLLKNVKSQIAPQTAIGIRTEISTLHRKRGITKKRVFNFYKGKKEKLIRCQLCSRRFKTKGNLNNHQKMHARKNQLNETENRRLGTLQVKPTAQPFTCSQCLKSFDAKQNLESHVCHAQNSETKSYQCRICPQSFGHKKEFQSHFRMHQNQNDAVETADFANIKTETTFNCHLCNKRYFKKYSLTVHLRTHNTFGPLNNFSQNATFSLKTPVPAQKQKKLSTVTSKHNCTWENCKKSFRSPSEVTRHIRTHTLEKPYKCSFCPKTFSEIGNRNKHEPKHGCFAKYNCKICKLPFNSFCSD